MGCRDFPRRQSLELHDGSAPCQAFGDSLHERELLRTSEDELSGLLPLSVHCRFQMTKELRCVLHLVDESGRRALGEEASSLDNGFVAELPNAIRTDAKAMNNPR